MCERNAFTRQMIVCCGDWLMAVQSRFASHQVTPCTTPRHITGLQLHNYVSYVGGLLLGTARQHRSSLLATCWAGASVCCRRVCRICICSCASIAGFAFVEYGCGPRGVPWAQDTEHCSAAVQRIVTRCQATSACHLVCYFDGGATLQTYTFDSSKNLPIVFRVLSRALYCRTIVLRAIV
jgi:hypothetical protein